VGGEKESDDTLAAQRSREIVRIAEYCRVAARQCHPGPSAVEPSVPGVIHAWLSNFGRNTAGVAELLNVVTRATISPSDTAA
jgi:hypothetical protein